MAKVLLMQGNQACAEGAIAAGVKFFAGYPITPSTEIAESLAKRLPQVGGKFIQMEDEIASMAAIIGASLTGKKVLTATSGPGFSLKQELIGYAAITETPVVIANVQRVGPSTGQPTAAAQGDVMQARWGTHGDHPIIALTPASVPECFSLTIKAYEMSEKYRVPVIFLMDEVIGHMREKIELPDYSEVKQPCRKAPAAPSADYQAYKPDQDLVPPMAAFGQGYRYHVTGLVHDETGFPNGSPAATAKLLKRLHEKIENHLDDIVLYEEYRLEDADTAIIAYGGTARSAYAAIDMAREQGIKAGMFRMITMWPFPDKQIAKLATKVKNIVVAEMNYGQVVGEVKRVVEGKAPVKLVAKYDSDPISPKELLQVLGGR
ncbi:2-oxoacid:acceptor oxidoreductase subunit alpha [Acetonema longum]|uniref:2-oxoglutarate oxidoreductase, alpha subunit, putative n=1 Tax=Acetonema longum DSM 6540 TaxID=1009370 RepID=F7NEM9_9FIRM|nr:2-oxoacid:acceptor oxidoreductase subunit alpha [Acetonema longum]EGO65440.1 2-oxoglutarate oxidoreductase, alpha subunit, putative [Acetonema longum DSM 6540]